MNDNFSKLPFEEETKKITKKKKRKMPLDMQVNFILVAFTLGAMILLALTKTILYFGPQNAAQIKGVFSIFIYSLSIIGSALSYLDKRKPSLELFLNIGAFVATLCFL